MGAGPEVLIDAAEVIGAIIRHHTRHNLVTVEVAIGHHDTTYPRSERHHLHVSVDELREWAGSDTADRVIDDGFALIAHMPWPPEINDLVQHLADQADRVVVTWRRGQSYGIERFGTHYVASHAVWLGIGELAIGVRVFDKA